MDIRCRASVGGSRRSSKGTENCRISSIIMMTPSRLLVPLLAVGVLFASEPVHATTTEELLNTLNPMPAGINLTDGASYDFIVVGAGSAGVATAARLALANASVLLVEAGGNQDLTSLIPGMAINTWGSDIDWARPTISNNKSCLASVNQQCRAGAGKCLGGSSSTNHLMYSRGHRQDFDGLGISNWTWADMFPFFLLYEGLRDLDELPASSASYHNTTGIMDIEQFSDSGNAWNDRLLDAFKELNFPFNADVSAKSLIGVSKVIGYVYNGTRMSTARAYLTNSVVNSTLNVAKHTRCTGVVIDDTNVARAVNLTTGTSENITVYANKEIILSAGVVATAQLLQLSGVGPKDHLTEMGIKLRADLPVGIGYSDHAMPMSFVLVDKSTNETDPVSAMAAAQAVWEVSQTGPLAANSLTDVTAFLNTSCYNFDTKKLNNDSKYCEFPTLHFVTTYIDRNLTNSAAGPTVQTALNIGDYLFNQLQEINYNYSIIVASFVTLKPKSRGTVRLASKDPFVDPAIYPNFLSHKEDFDEHLRAIKLVEHLVETSTFADQNATIWRPVLPNCPSYEENKEEYLLCYVPYATFTLNHQVGTAALGKVVDENLRVYNVKHLRVSDASVLPEPLSAATAAATTAVGERAAHFLVTEHGL